MLAVAFVSRDYDKLCGGGSCDASCHNVYSHISGWSIFTPEFESTIVLISSPVALLVALWGMASNATLQVMKTCGQERSMARRLI